MGHHPVYESMAAFVADVSRKLHHYHSEKYPDGKLRPPSSASRVLGKTRAGLVLLYIAAKKKCTGSKNGKHTEPAGDDQVGHGKSFPPPSPVRRALGKARAVIIVAFHSAKKRLDVIRAKEGGEGINEAPEAVAGTRKSVDGGGKLLSTPTSTPVRRALGKAREVVVSPFHAAMKKAHDRKEQHEHAEEGIPAPASEGMSGACNRDTLSQSQRHGPLGAVRAVVIYPFLHARKKKHATASQDEDTTIAFEETVEEAEHDRAWTSPGSTHSTPSSLGTKSEKVTPTRNPKALFRKVRAATVLLPFHSRKKTSNSEQPVAVEEALPTEEEGSSVEGGVWKKAILMGQKCEPLDFPGVIYYDSKGERLDGVPPRSPMSMVQQQLGNSVTEDAHQQHQQPNGFSFPAIIAGSGVNDRDFETER